MEIGRRLRNLRLSKKITLNKLSVATGLTISFLSQLERNITFPSVKSLRKIAQALQVKVAYFFEEETKDFVFIKNMTQRRFDKKLKAFKQTLISDILNIKMEPNLLKLKENGRLVERVTPGIGEEFGFICEGNIVLTRDRQKFGLKKGDFIYFMSIKPKRLVNIGKGEALILWTQLKGA
jgi:transcriptional regulator with XRE-family HTH domain